MGFPGIGIVHGGNHTPDVHRHVRPKEGGVLLETSLGVGHTSSVVTTSVGDKLLGEDDLTADKGVEPLLLAVASSE